MPPINPELQQNIAVTTELTILHNFWALSYFLGLIISIIWSIVRPSRAATFAFLGFGLLLFSFEYTKHILEPLKEQTVNSIITMQEHHTARRVLNASLIKIIPFGSFSGGVTSLLISIYLMRDTILRRNRKSPQHFSLFKNK